MVRGGTSRVTTEPAATRASSPTSRPGRITAPAPTRPPRRTVTPWKCLKRSSVRPTKLSFEVTTPELAEGLRALGFVDAGYLRNNGENTLAKPSSDHLASVGLGLRYTKGAFAASADYGRIVLGSKVPLAVNAAAPKRGDDKLYVNLSVRF